MSWMVIVLVCSGARTGHPHDRATTTGVKRRTTELTRGLRQTAVTQWPVVYECEPLDRRLGVASAGLVVSITHAQISHPGSHIGGTDQNCRIQLPNLARGGLVEDRAPADAFRPCLLSVRPHSCLITVAREWQLSCHDPVIAALDFQATEGYILTSNPRAFSWRRVEAPELITCSATRP
jgi:hypothetical protein